MPHFYLSPPLGLIPLEFRRVFFCVRNLESLGYRMALFEWSRLKLF